MLKEKSIEHIVSTLTPEIYDKLVDAVEIGRWADGVLLTEEQKENALQLVMLWQAKHNNSPDHMTINKQGQIEIESKQAMKLKFQGESIEIKQ